MNKFIVLAALFASCAVGAKIPLTKRTISKATFMNYKETVAEKTTVATNGLGQGRCDSTGAFAAVLEHCLTPVYHECVDQGLGLPIAGMSGRLPWLIWVDDIILLAESSRQLEQLAEKSARRC